MLKLANLSVTLVGSRVVPDRMATLAFKIGMQLEDDMFSGGAFGMDDTWEQSYIRAGRKDKINIIIPEYNFEGRVTDNVNYFCIQDREMYPQELIDEADEMIKSLHAFYDKLYGFAYWAHIRNCFQVLGHDLQSPSSECFLYAPVNGIHVKGGTNTAFRLCMRHGIPTHNLANPDTERELRKRFGIQENNLNFLWG